MVKCKNQFIIFMSNEQFTRKIEECRRALNAVRKDVQYRDQMVLRSQPTYSLDAEIKGQFIQIDDNLKEINNLLQNLQKNAKDFNLMPRDLEKKKQAYTVNVQEKNKLKRMYDESLTRKVANTASAKTQQNVQKFEQANKGKKLTKEELLVMKEQQEKHQDETLDDLLGVVKTMKTGQKQIKVELSEQDGLLNNLEKGMDENTQDMSKVRRNMTKLLDSSSYTCLILVILLEIAGLICNAILWKK